MEAILPIIIQLVTGAVGGNAIGGAIREQALGILGRTIAGAAGGVGGGSLLAMLAGGGADPTGGQLAALLGGFGGDLAGGAAGGGLLVGILGTVVKAMKGQQA
ncbi:hypothetical protein [Futiania mangrovi]|uniref:DNA methyltransferase n=1 Tax=Futiania mangrovi TaxID=2959716 RepID=A0A9J6PKG4_9PROT|nr:hypothetical protein [Futiania mangrovii]MCP1336562.1 hypothetical protein [Futiania mangrovii]